MSGLYPMSQPYRNGLLRVDEHNDLYWEAHGNPAGCPAVFLHGGPGSGFSADAACFFDPRFYNIILFDQRNCGRSRPSAADNCIDLSHNTTWHLVEDLERLRNHFAITRWLLAGISWGTTLALAYAQSYPAHVIGLVLAGVTTTRRSEIEWLTTGLSALFPQEWRRLLEGLPSSEDRSDVIAAYCALVQSLDREVGLKAAWDWHQWELATRLLIDPHGTPRRWADPLYRLARARIVLHYFHNLAWLEDEQLLRNAWKLSGIPGRLIQGRLDLEAPLTTAWELDQAWPTARLVIVEQGAHSPSSPKMAQAIVRATDEMHLLR